MYKNSLNCTLKCDDLNPHEDTQEHLICCKKLTDNIDINITQMYGSIEDQLKLSKQCQN